MNNEVFNFWNQITLEVDPFVILSDSEDFLKRASGTFMAVYAAYCKGNGKFYIGSSADIRRRINGHKRLLGKNIHGNSYLQRSYNKYGNDSFVWYALVRVEDKDELFSLEQIFLDVLLPFEGTGFNICTVAGKTRQRERGLDYLQKKRGSLDPVKIRDPNGVTHEFSGSFKNFASKHGISSNGISHLTNGSIKSHRGWTLPESEFQAIPVLVSPTGEEVSVPVASDFIKKYKLHKDKVYDLLKGKRDSFRGWFLKGGNPLPESSYPWIESPDGELLKVVNNVEFAKRHNLVCSSLLNVLNGKVKIYKGWKLSSDPEYLISSEGRFVKIKNRYHFCEENDITLSNLAKIFNGSHKEHKGFSSTLSEINRFKVSEFSNS